MTKINAIKKMEKKLILKVIKEMNGNHTKASNILGITTRTIRNKLHEYAREDEVG